MGAIRTFRKFDVTIVIEGDSYADDYLAQEWMQRLVKKIRDLKMSDDAYMLSYSLCKQDD